MQQQRIGEGSAITIVRRDWLGEPHQVATAATRWFDPFVVVPTESGITERVVVLARALGAGSSMNRHMQLVDDVQLRSKVPR